MTAIAYERPSWNWLRVGAWSGSFTVHALLLLIVAAPAIVPIARPEPTPVLARWIESPPKQPALPEPPPPTTPHRARPTPVHVIPSPTTPLTPASIPAPTIPAPTMPMETDAPGPTDDVSAQPAPQDIGPASGGATQELAYATPLQPMYPPASLRAHEQGTVLLRVLVDPAGVPQRVEIARSSGHARLDTAARDGVLRARFRPVMRDGAAVRAWGLVPIAFRLDRG